MKFSKYLYGLLLLALLYTDCISEFEPPSQGYENVLVVEAFLTNDDEPFKVSLSRSTPIDTVQFSPQSGASISLLNADGESYDLYEYSSGMYQTHVNPNPQVDQEYKLRIMTTTGMYESDFVKMRETPEIDSVNFLYEERKTAGQKGVQIYVNTHDPENNTWYYRWDYEEDWTFYTPFYALFYWDDGVYHVQENINRCWKSYRSKNIIIKSSTNLSQDIISQFPLTYVTNQSDRLLSKYSMNVKQYALSEASYNYWKELQKVTESLGTLFDPQPATIYGNIHNINDETEVVLGYFDASSVTEKRIYITRSDLPGVPFPDNYQYCEDSIVGYNQIAEMSSYGWYLYNEETNENGGLDYYMSISRACVDCTTRGTNVKPDFWQ